MCLSGPGWYRNNEICSKGGDEAFIVSSNRLLILLVLNVAHAGAAGHRGADSTINNLQENFSCPSLKKEVHTFVYFGFHVLSFNPFQIIAGPWSYAIHARKPNEFINFAYCHMC